MDDLVIRLQGLSVALVVWRRLAASKPLLRRPWPALDYRSVSLTRARSETSPARRAAAKTDTLDAEVIALFAERVRPQARPLREPERVHLAELVGRQQIIG